jgi:hypothetical protein
MLKSKLPCTSSYSEEELMLESEDWMLHGGGFGGSDISTLKTNRGTQIINFQQSDAVSEV